MRRAVADWRGVLSFIAQPVKIDYSKRAIRASKNFAISRNQLLRRFNSSGTIAIVVCYRHRKIAMISPVVCRVYE